MINLLKVLKLRRDIPEASRIPRFYGGAYVDHARNVAVFYPIPLNLIIRVLRALWLYFKAPMFLQDQVDIITLKEKHKILTDLGFTESKEGFLKKTNSGYLKIPKHLLNKDYTKQQFNHHIAKLTRYISKFHGKT